MRRIGPALLAFFVLGLASSPAAAKVLVSVDKSTQQMTVSVDGERRFVWPVSTGVPRYDTPSGRFTAFRMEKDHFSKEWDDAPMPYSIFFTTKGHAIHGTNHTSIGDPASHGCVRLSTPHAAQLYALVQAQGVTNTTVVLTGDVQTAWARRASRLAAGRDGTTPRQVAPPAEQAATMPADGYARSYGPSAYGTTGYGEAAPQPPRGVYARGYEYGADACPPPPPGFPAPRCSYGRAQMRAEAVPQRRYEYGQPQYEPEYENEAPPRRYPYGGY